MVGFTLCFLCLSSFRAQAKAPGRFFLLTTVEKRFCISSGSFQKKDDSAKAVDCPAMFAFLGSNRTRNVFPRLLTPSLPFFPATRTAYSPVFSVPAMYHLLFSVTLSLLMVVEKLLFFLKIDTFFVVFFNGSVANSKFIVKAF